MTRREVLGLFGIAGAALIVGCGNDSNSSTPTRAATGAPASPTTQAATAAATASGQTAAPACVVVPELTEGPYFVDEMLNRSDIRSDPSNNKMSDGNQLDIALNVSQVGGDGSCTPLSGAQVDVWHCDALGVYSDVSEMGFNTTGQKFLRGYQVTDSNGKAAFTTIYPGWYQGRATHIHFKIRSDDGREFTSQWFFDDALSDTVQAQGAYASKGVAGRLQNSGDNIYQGTNGLLTLDIASSGNGYAASFDIGVRTA
jgi:protocatechuate 3,4-dioxygenase beta subunit